MWFQSVIYRIGTLITHTHFYNNHYTDNIIAIMWFLYSGIQD